MNKTATIRSKCCCGQTPYTALMPLSYGCPTCSLQDSLMMMGHETDIAVVPPTMGSADDTSCTSYQYIRCWKALQGQAQIPKPHGGNDELSRMPSALLILFCSYIRRDGLGVRP